MTRVACQTTIRVPADAVWQVIGDFGAACQYLARVVNCTVEGALDEPPGAVYISVT